MFINNANSVYDIFHLQFYFTEMVSNTRNYYYLL